MGDKSDMTGQQMRAIRRALGMTQTDLARRIGVSRKHVSWLEQQPSLPPLYVLAMQSIEAHANA